MIYPPDGTPFEIDSPTIGLLYKAVSVTGQLTREERKEARTAIDYICAATLLVPETEDEEEDDGTEGDARRA